MKRWIFLFLTFAPSSICTAQNSEFYGTTIKGGNGYGVIYKLDENGENLKVVHKFGENCGGLPLYSKLVEGKTNKLYGLLSSGGAFNHGVLFEYDIVNEEYSKLVDFDKKQHGDRVFGNLILHSNGKLYGTAYAGGEHDDGTLFEFSPDSNIFKKILDFEENITGSLPVRKLCSGKDGKIYGTAAKGPNGYGLIFSYNPIDNNYKIEYNFQSYIEGGNSTGGLIQGKDGWLYGMTQASGANSLGVLYKYNPQTSTFNKLKDFNNMNTGVAPTGSLTEVDSGVFYGLTVLGGQNNLGTIFCYNSILDSLYILKSFDGLWLGEKPWGSLELDTANNVLYGVASDGGLSQGGVLFSYHYKGDSLKSIHSFSSTNGKGYSSYGTPYLHSNGNIYGLTEHGGKSNRGVLFEFDPNQNVYKVKVEFEYITHGAYPTGKLTEGNDGFIYGTTERGGEYGNGTIFRYSISGNNFTTLYSFKDSVGIEPNGDLILIDNNTLIGTCRRGGKNNYGSIFEYSTTNNQVDLKYSFDNTTSGAYPTSGLSKNSQNDLVGYTTIGGVNNSGVIFKYSRSQNMVSVIFDLGDQEIGRLLDGNLVYENNTIVATSNSSQLYTNGVIFKLNVLNSKIDIYHIFNGNDGKWSVQGLLKFPDGSYFGNTNRGGFSDSGVVFRYAPLTDQYTIIEHLGRGSKGGFPFQS